MEPEESNIKRRSRTWKLSRNLAEESGLGEMAQKERFSDSEANDESAESETSHESLPTGLFTKPQWQPLQRKSLMSI